jgi:hypothetical protein
VYDEHGDTGFHADREGMRIAQERAEFLTNRVRASLVAGYSVDLAYWTESRPAYGSDAYIAGGWSAIDAEEEHAAAW